MTDNQKKLLNILKEMFQFDQADLDFGIYRIMRLKREEISRFIENDLPVQITEGLRELAGIDIASDIATIDKQIADTKAAPLSDAIKTAAVSELEVKKKALAGNVDINSMEADVYNHLTNFFARYYDEGDFISQRRYKEGAYAIPFEGEEVKLHWANADQYYVKTSEYFKDYTFKTMYGEDIRFKLVEADTERDNNKANEKRFFLLYTVQPFEVVDGTLVIYVEYKNGSKKNQAECTSEIVAAFSSASAKYQDYSALLTVSDGKTLLERQLNRYTARNTFDYFIHKNLGIFLNRELDFYIKNDVIFLDDIDEQDEAKTKEYLTKAKIIRKISRKIITLLAQIEDFQKKLYLKKKFVVETNYCITLDRIPEAMYSEIAVNNAQREEWVSLYAIDEIEGDLTCPAYSAPLTVEFLKANPYLMMDTMFFGIEFKEKLIDSIDDLDEQLGGLMIQSENSQALHLLTQKYRKKISGIYADPPYNTNASEILYKNGYKDSSWISMMNDRIRIAADLLSEYGIACYTIDDLELNNLSILLNDVFGKDNYLANVLVRNNPSGRSTVKGFSINHEYALFYARSNHSELGRMPHNDTQKNRYSLGDEQGSFEWENFRKNGTDSNREDRPKQFYPIVINKNTELLRVPNIFWNNATNAYIIEDVISDDELILFPYSGTEEKVWKFGIERTSAMFGELLVKKTPTGYELYRKKYLNEGGSLPRTWWDKAEYSARDNGTRALTELFGASRGFDFPKAPKAVEDCIRVLNVNQNNIVLDFFAGSGTTAAATIALNRYDEEKRKYILVEMGEYFSTVTKPRIQKVIYSMDTDNQKGWKDGKPVSRIGSSHAFKYLRLESYEDALSNIILRGGDYDMLGAAREEYLLSYMLDSESAGSDSLLNVQKLDKPFSYAMNITRNLESAKRTIDLVETFNYLIGLTVVKSHALTTFDADFTTGEYGALTASLKAGDTYKFKAVDGKLPNGEKVLVLWREMTGDTAMDNAILDACFLALPDARKHRKIYVNCDNNLMNLRTNGESWQVVLIDEEIKKRMFDTAE